MDTEEYDVESCKTCSKDDHEGHFCRCESRNIYISKVIRSRAGSEWEKKVYVPLEIPQFDDMDLSEEDMIKCRNLYEQLCKVMRDRCGIFEIHIAYHTICKIKELTVESMKLNIQMIIEEKKRREDAKKN